MQQCLECTMQCVNNNYIENKATKPSSKHMKHFNASLNQVYHDYIHNAPVPVPVRYNLQREFHKFYAPPTSVT
jgi:hypothetical protein